MNLTEYQQIALRTAAKHPDKQTALTVWALGLCGEAGEVADLIKKHIGHGHPLDRQKLLKELGDLCWYVVVMANEALCSIEKIWLRSQILFTKNKDLGKASLRLCINAALVAIEIDACETKPNSREISTVLTKTIVCIQAIATAIDSSLDEVLALNKAKLEERYPDGFSVERSLNRQTYDDRRDWDYAEQCEAEGRTCGS